MLTLPEELLLLAHDEKSGSLIDLPDIVLNVALAGAVLMDLALRDRIDTDLETAVIVSEAATGEDLLDAELARLARTSGNSLSAWLDLLRADGPDICAAAFARLIERGIIRAQSERVLWVFETRRYPLIDPDKLHDVHQRILALLLSDDIPDPRDIVVIALAQACGLLSRVFTAQELHEVQPRIEQIARLDLAGQAMRSMMEELQGSLAMTTKIFS